MDTGSKYYYIIQQPPALLGPSHDSAVFPEHFLLVLLDFNGTEATDNDDCSFAFCITFLNIGFIFVKKINSLII
jgi:hypothetical protein